MNHIKNKYNLAVGERTSENIKIDLGCCSFNDSERLGKKGADI